MSAATSILRTIRGGREPGERPTIEINTELRDVVDQACEALATDRDIYQRGGQLVRVVRVAENEASALAAVGTPQIRDLAIPTLRERLSDAAIWQRYSKRDKAMAETLPPDKVVQAVAARGEWSGIAPLAGIIETPSMRPDGTIIATRGYDSATATLYLPSREYPPVPEYPSQDQAAAALAELAEVWCDFPHATDADRYVPIAATLTLVARPAILGPVPAVATDANVRGAGKTLENDAVVTAATGRRPAKMTFPSDPAELEKVLGAYAIRGALVVPFDNIDGPFRGAPLDKCLTAWPTVELRVLGRSEVPTLPWRAMVLVTGNGLAIEGDTSRRTLIARLESPEENPEDREGFRHPELLSWVEAEHPRLVCAALTVLRGYVAAGRPAVPIKPWGSFEAWSALVPAAIVWAGGADVMQARATLATDEEPEKAALRAILTHWPKLAPDGCTLRHALGALYSREQLRGEAEPDGFDELREALETLAPPRPGAPPEARKLGNALRKQRRRVVGGKRFEVVPDDPSPAKRWRVR